MFQTEVFQVHVIWHKNWADPEHIIPRLAEKDSALLKNNQTVANKIKIYLHGMLAFI